MRRARAAFASNGSFNAVLFELQVHIQSSQRFYYGSRLLVAQHGPGQT